MSTVTKKSIILFVIFLLWSVKGLADNPIIPKQGVCDPHIHIFNGKAYLFATHDEKPGNTAYTMNDWWLWSSSDLITWTKEFTLNPTNTYVGTWNKCYATDGATRNGKYYFYFSKHSLNTGVAVSTSGPAGPYTDALGKELTGGWDPTSYIDDDVKKTPYLIYGGFPYKIVKLNEDMISFADTPQEILYVDKNSGWSSSSDGNFIHKHNGLYYLNQHNSRYGTSTSIYGPYTYRGQYYPGWNDHGTFFVWNNQDYLAYGLGDVDNFFRKTNLTYVYYKDNGEMVADVDIANSSLGVGQYDSKKTIQAEWYFAASDGTSKNENVSGFELRNLGNNSYLYYPNIRDVKANTPISFQISSANASGGTIEVHEDSINGILLGSCTVSNTGSWTNYQTVTDTLTNSTGDKKIYLVFKGTGTELMRLDYFNVENSGLFFTLTTSAVNGSVSPSSGTYSNWTKVTLTATANLGYEFAEWSGDLTGKENPTVVLMDKNKSITANFASVPTYTLTANIPNATIELTPSGGVYNTGTVVSVLIKPNVGYVFSGWGGDLSGSTNPTTITMNSNKTITANLTIVPVCKLTTKAENGTVTLNPAGGTYNKNTVVTVKATPNAGYLFSYWSGDPLNDEFYINPNRITMDSDKSITANFSATSSINAFSQIEAESYNDMYGVQKETCSEGGQNIGYIENGDYIVFYNVNFGSGAASFDVRAASSGSGGSIEIRLDSISGTLVGTCVVTGTGGWQNWATKSCALSGASGMHNLYLKFTGGTGYLFNVNWFKFNKPVSIDQQIMFPQETKLSQNYPNPFNPETTISYQLSEPSHTKIIIRNTLGQEIKKLVDRDQAAGHYSVTWNGRDFNGNKVASGIYFYALETNNAVITKKLVLLQ